MNKDARKLDMLVFQIYLVLNISLSVYRYQCIIHWFCSTILI